MLLRIAALCLVALALDGPSIAYAREALLRFEVNEGRNLNEFLRQGDTAAHLVLRSGRDLRVLVAFPAGDSGVALWFQRLQVPARWTLEASPRAIQARDSRGRALHGILFEASVAARRLMIRQALLSSIRVLRNYQGTGTAPQEILVRPVLAGHTLTWSRTRLDGAPGYRLTLEVMHGSLLPGAQGISSGPDGRILLRITALSGERPLTPLSGAQLFNGSEARDTRARDTLTFLSYKEKYLAGSWRFDTYFGRDTLMSVRLLMPVLTPQAIEAGLRAVLARLAPDGEVAHEETIGEFAVLTHQKEDGVLSDAPILDYGMIDGNELLAPVTAAYLLDTAEGKRRSAVFLRENVAISGPQTLAGQALLRNLRLVVTQAAPFAAAARYENLLALKPGHTAGEWRDSTDGIGGGRYPYDVNAVFMPAALDATAHLLDSGLLDPFLAPGDRKLLARAAAEATIWRRSAPPLFDVTLDNASARAAITAYAQHVGVPATDALAALGAGPVTFHAVSLDAAGRPVPILNSDEGFALLFTTPAPDELDAEVRSVMRPFPAGLLTGAGLLVANPAFASAGLQARFTSHAYHGTVVWSWQQALFASGLARQLERVDLPDPIKEHLLKAQKTLWRVIHATQSLESSELWSWRFQGGHYSVAPFGSSSSDVDESNAAQLWSSVYLAVKPPSTQ